MVHLMTPIVAAAIAFNVAPTLAAPFLTNEHQGRAVDQLEVRGKLAAVGKAISQGAKGFAKGFTSRENNELEIREPSDSHPVVSRDFNEIETRATPGGPEPLDDDEAHKSNKSKAKGRHGHSERVLRKVEGQKVDELD